MQLELALSPRTSASPPDLPAGPTLSNLGAVYTPAALADWVASLLLDALPATARRFLDPACGDGALLAAVGRQRPGAQLQGFDLDPDAVLAAGGDNGRQVRRADGLQALATLDLHDIDGFIANPPWGADLPRDREALAALGYTVVRGQVDTWDLFVEGLLRAARPGAAIALILPDSLFLPQHEPVRRLLLQQATLLQVARLGEGLFPGVFRGTTVLVLRKAPPPPGHAVECLRLDPDWRKQVLSGRASFAAARAALAHPVRQARFAADDQARLDIDLRDDDHQVVVRIEERPMAWTRWLVSGRGVELSKTGQVVLCPACGLARPRPRGRDAKVACAGCGRSWTVDDGRSEEIVAPLADGLRPGWAVLAVGEDVDRHTVRPSRQIRLSVPGIQYKPAEWFSVPKLLVRKTGVGIKAAVDRSGAWTNQVVFHFSVAPDRGAPDFLLDYLQGVLCSRVLLAWHLARQGENEWRSHPYLTQKVIQGFPVPDLEPGTPRWARAQAIAAAVRGLDGAPDRDGADLQLERLVAGLFGLQPGDMTWVHQVLADAQQLEPIRTVMVSDPALLRPLPMS